MFNLAPYARESFATVTMRPPSNFNLNLLSNNIFMATATEFAIPCRTFEKSISKSLLVIFASTRPSTYCSMLTLVPRIELSMVKAHKIYNSTPQMNPTLHKPTTLKTNLENTGITLNY